MDVRKIESELKEFLMDDHLADEFKKLSNDDSLLERGIIDSVKMLELVEFVESQYKIKVDEDDLVPEYFDSINAIVSYIVERLPQNK